MSTAVDQIVDDAATSTENGKKRRRRRKKGGTRQRVFRLETSYGDKKYPVGDGETLDNVPEDYDFTVHAKIDSSDFADSEVELEWHIAVLDQRKEKLSAKLEEVKRIPKAARAAMSVAFDSTAAGAKNIAEALSACSDESEKAEVEAAALRQFQALADEMRKAGIQLPG